MFLSGLIPYQLYFDGYLEEQMKPVYTVGQGSVLLLTNDKQLAAFPFEVRMESEL